MPAPATVDELLDLVQRSGVADDGRVKSYMQKLAEQGGAPAEPSKLASHLVRDGLLTYFQAEQLLQGKWKRFTIGKYKVLERIGAGGMGQVFLCEHKLMRRRVAVKVLPTAKADDPSSLERFYREARVIAAVDHPNIVRAYDIDQDDNLHFLVMEYVDGTNLQDLVKKSGKLDPLRASHYVYGAAVGLQHAHEAGLVHRDIKPGNILVDRSGMVKVLDLGLARFFHDEDDVLTKKYDENVLGTADYLAPEQAVESHGVDIRADIYALGATFYFMLTGSAVFPEGSIAQKLIWHQTREPRPLQSLRPDVPDGLAAVVAKMMAKRPEDRYQTPAEVMDALAPWVTTPIPPPTDKELPQLSPAAAGYAPGPPQPPRPVAAGTRPVPSLSGMPATVAGAGWPTQSGLTPAAAPRPVVPSDGHAVWEALSSETAATTQSDTVPRPAPPAAPADTPPAAAPAAAPKRLPVAALAVGGLVVAAGVAAAVYAVAFRNTDAPAPPPGDQAPPGAAAREGRRLLVAKAPQPGGEPTFASLQLALKHCRAGDTIVLVEDRIQEGPLRLEPRQHRDLTIESGARGKPAVVEFVPQTGGGSYMLEVAHLTEGVRLKGIEFDARGHADIGVAVSGNAAGTTLDGVTVRGAAKAAVKLINAAGEPGRPLLVEDCKFVIPKGGDGVWFAGNPRLPVKHVVVRDSRFLGTQLPPAAPGQPAGPWQPGRAGVRIDCPTVDAELSGNRFYQLEVGLAVDKLSEGLVRLGVTNNTFVAVREGLVFDLAGADSRVRYELTVAHNYFARLSGPQPGQPGGSVARHTGGTAPKDIGTVFRDNARDKTSRDSPTMQATQVDVPDLPVNPDDERSFLRYPATSPLNSFGPKKQPVGAPPAK